MAACRIQVYTDQVHAILYCLIERFFQFCLVYIVNYRAENGAFGSRKELMKVPRMGAKAFEQCAGFLRIPGAKNPLDNTAVHPESYHIVEQMAKDLKCTIDELIADKELRRKINISAYITPTVGLPGS